MTGASARAPILELLGQVHARKDAAYRDAWRKRGELLGIFPNIARKYDRLTVAMAEEEPATVEPLGGTVGDLCVYAAKYLTWLAEIHPDAVRATAHGPDPEPLRADRGAQAVNAVFAQLPEAEEALSESSPKDVADSWDRIRDAFRPLEAGLMEQAERPASDPPPAKGKVELAWRLTGATAWMLLRLNERDPRHLDSLRAEAEGDKGMSDEFERELVGAALEHVSGGRKRIALLGLTPTALRVRRQLAELAPRAEVLGVFDPDADAGSEGSNWSDLGDKDPDLLVVCADAEKQHLLSAYRDLERSSPPGTGEIPAVVIAGTAHLAFRDPLFDEISAPTLAPSYANGSPNTLVHLYQCLQAAAANELRGAVVEFGCFKGGTSVLLSRIVKRLGLRDCPLLAFDSFAGFPPPRSALDLYRHPRCEFTAEEEVRAYLEPHGVEVVSGDIAESYKRLEGMPLLLCFFDTDNYTPALAALEHCVDQLVPGGAIVFDHYATVPDFVYTLGERMAADEVLANRGLLHLHDTGVFVKLDS